MKSSKSLVGFDRYVEREWLDEVARIVVDGNSLINVNEKLDSYLAPIIDGETSRRKTKNILTATWAKSQPRDVCFKRQAVDMFADANRDDKLAIHYGICVATYPFFVALSKILGRLFKLQDEVNNTEFYRRVIEVVGDRESIKRAAARYLQSLIEWGVLAVGSNFSVRRARILPVDDPVLVTWLYSATLYSSDRERLSVDDIVSDPCWFPFEISQGHFNYQKSGNLEVVHHSVGSTLVALRS